MEDYYLATIYMFGGNFAPRGWMFCQGQVLPINEYEALYTLIGTIYGGDGQTTFALPNLAGRAPVGTGQGVGLSNYSLGMVTGTEGVTLNQNQLPTHIHPSQLTMGSGDVTVTANLNGATSGGGGADPSNALLGTSVNGNTVYAKAGTATTPMAPAALTVSNLAAPLPNFQVSAAGSSQLHNNMQPYLAVNFIICVEGLFPSRN